MNLTGAEVIEFGSSDFRDLLYQGRSWCFHRKDCVLSECDLTCPFFRNFMREYRVIIQKNGERIE